MIPVEEQPEISAFKSLSTIMSQEERFIGIENYSDVYLVQAEEIVTPNSGESLHVADDGGGGLRAHKGA